MDKCRALLFSLGLLGSQGLDASACGDKFVVMGQGVRFWQTHPAVHPASILVYTNPGSSVAEAERALKLKSALSLVGHKPKVVSSRVELDTALGSGRYDIVLADLATTAALESDLASAERGRTPAKPTIVPVLYNPKDEELQAAEKKYGCTMKATRKNRELMIVLDEVMESKKAGVDPNCEKSRSK